MVSGGAEAKFKVMSVKASRPVTAGSRMTTSNDGDILPDSKTGSYACTIRTAMIRKQGT